MCFSRIFIKALRLSSSTGWIREYARDNAVKYRITTKTGTIARSHLHLFHWPTKCENRLWWCRCFWRWGLFRTCRHTLRALVSVRATHLWRGARAARWPTLPMSKIQMDALNTCNTSNANHSKYFRTNFVEDPHKARIFEEVSLDEAVVSAKNEYNVKFRILKNNRS